MGRGIIQTNIEKLSETLKGITKLTQEYKETKAPETYLSPVIPGVYIERPTGTVSQAKAKEGAKKVLGAGARGLMREYIKELPQEQRAQQVTTLARRGGASTELLDKFKKDLTEENIHEIYNLQQYYTTYMSEVAEGSPYQGTPLNITFPEIPSIFPKIDWKMIGLFALGLGALYVIGKGGSKK